MATEIVHEIETPIKNYHQTLELESNTSLEAGLCFTTASLLSLQKKLNEFLHPEELKHYKTLSFERRQWSYLLGRYCAKHAISRYENHLTFSDILIKPGAFEQPVVYSPGNKKIQITLSHCEDLGVALVFPETHPMGIDIEIIQSSNQDIIKTQLTANEKRWIERSPYTASKTLYALFWTLKESLSKVLRTGMTTPFEIYALKNIVFKHNHWISDFEHFTQYQAMSFILGKKLFSVVYPKQTLLSINIPSIQDWISSEPPHA